MSPEVLTSFVLASADDLAHQLTQATERLVTDSAYRRQISLHESAHIIFGHRMNMLAFEVHLPKILPLADGRVFASGASVSAQDFANCKVRPDEDIDLCYARFYAAGGVATEASDLGQWGGVTAFGDFHYFVDYMRDRGRGEDASSYWARAVREVRTEFRGSAFQSKGGLRRNIEKYVVEVSNNLLLQGISAMRESLGKK